MKQVNINDLLWDTENLEIEGKKYFTWQEAMEAANSVGKRLPTREEFEALIKTGYEFDEEKKGMWFADRKLFFPLYGLMGNSSGTFQYAPYGYYWSSSPQGTSYSWGLNFNSSSAGVGRINAKFSFPVRCVQDISDNLIIDKNNMEKTYSQWKSASCEPPEDMQIVFVKAKSKNLLAGLGVGYKLPGRMAFEVGDDIISYEDEYSDVFWTEVPK